MAIKPASLPAEASGLEPFATWYAELFHFNGRKCLLFYNPSTGYAMVSAYVSKTRMSDLGKELRRRFETSMRLDGVSLETRNRLLAGLTAPSLARTADRSARGFVVRIQEELGYLMPDSVLSDPDSIETDAHYNIVHSLTGPIWNPIEAFNRLTGENIAFRLHSEQKLTDVCQVVVTLQDSSPRIWRRLVVPSGLRLNRVHLMICTVFGWRNTPLHLFHSGDSTFGPRAKGTPVGAAQDESKVGLFDALSLGDGDMEYLLEGDRLWRHSIRLEVRQRALSGRYPYCLKGYGHLDRENPDRTMSFNKYSDRFHDDEPSEEFSVDQLNLHIEEVFREMIWREYQGAD